MLHPDDLQWDSLDLMGELNLQHHYQSTGLCLTPQPLLVEDVSE